MRLLLAAFTIFLLMAGCAPSAPNTEAGSSIANTFSVETPVPDALLTEFPAPTPELLSNPTAPVVTEDALAETFGPTRYAILQNYTPAISAHFGSDWNMYQMRGADFNSTYKRLALAGCTYDCDRYSNGQASLLLLDGDQKTPLRALAIDPLARITDADFTPDGNHIIFSSKHRIMEYNLADDTSRVLMDATGSRYEPINDISPDGRYLASVIDGTVIVFELDSMREVFRVAGTNINSFFTEFFNLSGDRILISRGTGQSQFAVYDLATQDLLREVDFGEPGKAALSPDGSQLAFGGKNTGMVKLIDVANGKEVWSVETAFKAITALTFHPEGSLIYATGRPDDRVSIFETVIKIDTATGEPRGKQLSITEYFFLLFVDNEDSLLAVSSYALSLSAPETDEVRRVAAFVEDYFAAITRGDYAAASGMTSLDELSLMELEDKGLGADDLEDVLAGLCTVDDVPCLPLGEVVQVGMSDGEYWDYEALVTLQAPDGGTLLFDGIEPYEYMGIIVDDQGNLKITTLHPGMRYPFTN